MADEEAKLQPPAKRLKLERVIQNCDDEKPGCSKEAFKDNTVHEPTEPVDDNSDNLSEISNLSGLSEEAWKPTSGAMMWIQQQIMNGVNPRPILRDLIPDDAMLPDDLDDFTMWKIVISIMSEPTPRKKLSHINTFQDAINLLQKCQNIMVLTGAGVSVSCGIPDFRSRDGIYARLAVDFPDLPDPQAMFDINYFKNDQRPFFKFAKEIYPGQFEPSQAHKFISTIEKQGKLLRNYTQNIDTLEQVAGISKVIQCHGSFATATCMTCKHKVDAEVVREDIFNQVIPKCPVCLSDNASSIMKPDIVFFGESLSDEFHKQMTADKDQCDLLIVIGSSLKVRPVALIPNSLPEHIPQILINREPLKHLNFDVELLGDCDTIIEEIYKHLSWDEKARSPVFDEVSKSELKTPTPSEIGDSSYNKDQISEAENDKCCENDNGQRLKFEKETCCKNESDDDKPLTLSENCKTSSGIIKSETCECSSKIHSNTKNVSQKAQHDSSSESSATDKFKNDKTADKVEGSSQDNTEIESDVKKTAGSFNKDSIGESTESKNNSALPIDSQHVSRSLEDFKGSEGDRDDLEEMRSMWKPRYISLARRLGEKQYLFLPPSRYVFSGAEVYSDMDEDSDSDSSSIDSTSDDDMESENSLLDMERENFNSKLVNEEKTDFDNEQVSGEKKDSNSQLLNGEKKDSNSQQVNGERKDSNLQLVNGNKKDCNLQLVNSEKKDLDMKVLNGIDSINYETDFEKNLNVDTEKSSIEQSNNMLKPDLLKNQTNIEPKSININVEKQQNYKELETNGSNKKKIVIENGNHGNQLPKTES